MKIKELLTFLVFMILLQGTGAQSEERINKFRKPIINISRDSIDFYLIGKWSLSSETWTYLKINGNDTTKITSKIMGCEQPVISFHADKTLVLTYPTSEFERFGWRTNGNELSIINFNKIKNSIFSDSIFTMQFNDFEGIESYEGLRELILTEKGTTNYLTLLKLKTK